MRRNIIILVALIVLFAMPVLAKPMVMVINPLVDDGFIFNELSDEELNNIKGQFLANELGNVYIGGGIYDYKGLSEFWEKVLRKANVPDFIIELMKNMPKGEYLLEIWKDPQTGKIIIEITPKGK